MTGTAKRNTCIRFKAFYEEIADQKGDMISHYQYYAPRRRLNETISIIMKEEYESIIDVGCGDGILLKEIEQNCQIKNNSLLLIGMDISELRLRRTIKRTSAKVCNADAENLPFRGQQFDLTICGEVIEHVPNPENVIKELSRITRPGGKLLISIPVACWQRTLLATLFKKEIWYVDEKEHLREYSYFNINRFDKISYLFNSLKCLSLEIRAVTGVFFFVIGLIERSLNRMFKLGWSIVKIFDLIDQILGKLPFIKYFGRYLIIECKKLIIRRESRII
jgi:ubiquinone/menaquinone biosynthesis C-methylase UbiE